jgi:ketosteroid isomerase-like protein
MSEVAKISVPDVVGAMPDTRDCIAAFYAAYRSRDLELLNAILDDRIEWFLMGPADHFDFYGARHGKEAVIEVISRLIPCYFHVTDFEFDQTLIDGERVATRGRIRARQRDTGRSIRYGFAHFLRFERGKLVSLRGVGDTFDVAEQVVGHPIDINRAMECVSPAPEDDLSSV